MPRKEQVERLPGELRRCLLQSLRKGPEELEQRLRRLESEATRRQEELEEACRVVEWHDVTEIRSFRIFHIIFYTSDVHPSGTLGSLVGPYG